jgi:outer membrane protein OmpA-like peptidoglycan-associated protein
MKKVSRSFLFIILIFLSNSIFSQSTNALFKEGHKLFKLEHYRNALPFLEKVIEAEPNNAEAVYEAGVCYLHRYSKEKALQYILKAYSLDSNVSKYIHYWMGRAYHQNYQYDKAISEYNIYKSNFRQSDQRSKEVEKHINQTNTARQLSQDPENFRVANLGPEINTIFSEHSPVTSSNDSILLFTSRRKNNIGGKEDQDGEFYEDIFQTRKSGSSWSTPEQIPLNTSAHDGSVQLLENDTKLLLYRESKGGDIYITDKDPATGKWNDPQKFANINTADYESDAFITADGKRAYFASNHYKKVGDLDIYFIDKKEDGTWSKPQELQGNINTNEDDDAPFITPDGKTMYFSSRGHKNMGGFDIFKSTLDPSTDKWSQPVNLGYPINTPDDDVYYYMSASGKKGYLSSYREGGFGEKDIYEITPITNVNIVAKVNPCGGNEQYNYSLKSLNKTTKPVFVTGKIAENQFTANISSYNTYRLAIYGSKDTLYTENIEVPFMEEGDQTIEKTFTINCPEPPKDDTSSVSATSTVASNKSSKYILRNIPFDKGSDKVNAEGQQEIDIASEILKKNPGSEVVIKGSALKDEKKTLASSRAKVVYDQLKAKGVNNVRLDSVNENQGKGQDGRSALLDLKLKDQLTGEFDPAIISKYSVGTTYVLRDVYFETAKAELRSAAKKELDILVDVLKENPTVNIEIAGHTDGRGSETLNMALSEKRAQTALKYVLGKGISNDRVVAKGYGETQPIGDNETEAGRTKNRRTELRIVKK